jgi:hypothetical protein
MSIEESKHSSRHYIIKSNVGLMIMRVEPSQIEKFLSVYGDQVIATGASLTEVLMDNDWTRKVIREKEQGKTPTTNIKTNPL